MYGSHSSGESYFTFLHFAHWCDRIWSHSHFSFSVLNPAMHWLDNTPQRKNCTCQNANQWHRSWSGACPRLCSIKSTFSCRWDTACLWFNDTDVYNSSQVNVPGIRCGGTTFQCLKTLKSCLCCYCLFHSAAHIFNESPDSFITFILTRKAKLHCIHSKRGNLNIHIHKSCGSVQTFYYRTPVLTHPESKVYRPK